MNNMQLITTKQFNGIDFDCYQEMGNTEDFWATRDQIGRLLGYSDPRVAIAKIHDRYKNRLDRFSGVTSLVTPGGEQETTIYNFKGLLEICRFSRQPNADAVMDFCWDVMDELRRTGSVSVRKKPSVSMSDKLLIVESAARMLNMNDASKILMLERFCEQEGTEALFLPKYEDNGGRYKIIAGK